MSSSARASDARVAERLAVDAVLLGDAHGDVADRLVRIRQGLRERVRDLVRLVPHDARVGDDRLVANLGPLVAQRALEARCRPSVAYFAERREGHLPHVRILVLDRHEEGCQRLGRAEVCQG